MVIWVLTIPEQIKIIRKARQREIKQQKWAVLLQQKAKKNAFKEKESTLTTNEWVHTQYGIDLNFLSPKVL